MSRGFEAVSAVTVDAPRAKVWDALTDPAKSEQCLLGTHMSTDWEVGGPIAWTGEWKGRSYVDKGIVLEFEPERRLRYTHWSPMGGSEDKPENGHTVTYELAEGGGRTTLTLIQDNNATRDEADRMAQDNWDRCCRASRRRLSGSRARGAPVSPRAAPTAVPSR